MNNNKIDFNKLNFCFSLERKLTKMSLICFHFVGGKVVYDVQDILDIPIEKIMALEKGDRSSQF